MSEVGGGGELYHGLISLRVNFHDNRTRWTVFWIVKICRWGGGEEKEPGNFLACFKMIRQVVLIFECCLAWQLRQVKFYFVVWCILPSCCMRPPVLLQKNLSYSYHIKWNRWPNCSNFRYKSNKIFELLGVVFFSSDKFWLFD